MQSLKIVTGWEQSGNGFGQRNRHDNAFGHFSVEHENHEDGDNRASYIRTHLGHRVHHLYLWQISDKMGILQDVLCVLNADVGGDGDNINTDTAQEREDDEERTERKRFRNTVGSALSAIALSTTHETLQKEEDKVLQLRLEMRRATNEEDREFYVKLIEHHLNKITELTKEVKNMRNALFGSDNDENEE